MAKTTSIAYADSTWSPWVGCSHESPACSHCYAEAQNKFRKWNGGTWGPGTPRKVTAHASWRNPIRWNHEAALGVCGKDGQHWIVFVGDHCDIFDEEGPTDVRREMWELIRATPHLTWLMLTKRPQHFSQYLPADWGPGYENVWLGVTAENRHHAHQRLAILRNTPAKLRFASFEPLLEDLHDLNLDGIDWAIVGGESGGKARPFDLAWAHTIKAMCKESSTKFFFKQTGANPFEDGNEFKITHKKPCGKRDVSGTYIGNFPIDLQVQSWPSMR